MWRKVAAVLLLALMAWVAPGIGGPATGTPTEVRIAECVAGPNVDTKIIQELRAEGWGYGEIAMAFYLAQKSGQSASVQDIVNMRSQGMGWGQIAQELRLPPSTLGKAQKALRSCTQQAKGATQAGKQAKGGNPPKGNQGKGKGKGR